MVLYFAGACVFLKQFLVFVMFFCNLNYYHHQHHQQYYCSPTTTTTTTSTTTTTTSTKLAALDRLVSLPSEGIGQDHHPTHSYIPVPIRSQRRFRSK